MERIALVELDIDRCNLTYGSSPCAAAIGVTGDDKCFNCLATCQDTDNYSSETVTVTYSYASSDLSNSIDAIPSIKSIDLRPAKLDLGESIGIRANVTINLMDSRSPDTGPDGDKYLSDRSYNPYEQGTYWGKFRARYPFTKGSDIRILRGTNDQSKDQMEVRHFIVEKLAGPNSNGQFTIVCKDALKLADSTNSKAPTLSTGTVKTAITDTETTLLLSPDGAGVDYPTSGFVNIGGSEICSFTRSSDTLTITRAQNNTEASSHDVGERVQLCLVYSGEKVTDIIYDLLVNYANVPSEYIPISDWIIEEESYIRRLYSATIADPEGATELINELLQQTASCIWWDDSAKLIRFRVLRAVDSNAALYDDNIIVSGSFSAVDQPDKRVSQVWTYYGQINPLEDLDQKKNYSNSLATIASEEEENYGEPSIKTIFSRWISRDNRDAAERLNLLILSRYSTPPRLLSFGLQRDSSSLITPELGGGYNVNNWTMQAANGATINIPVQAIQVRTSDTGHSVMAEEVLYSETIAPEEPNIKNMYIEASRNNYDLWQEVSSQRTVESGDTVNLFVSSGIIVGSDSILSPAMTIGTGWPDNITINLINDGNIYGKGGIGGNGGRIDELTESPFLRVYNGGKGGIGGVALEIPSLPSGTTLAITTSGTIGGGGGGGGGGGATRYTSFSGASGSGGGGGAQGGSGGAIGARPSGKEFIAGNAGSAAGDSVGGSGGARVLAYTPTAYNGAGGKGGDLGQDGSSGGDATGSPEGTEGAQYFGSDGGAGGAAGNAINKNGNSVTITNNGTILGTINP